MNEQLDELQYQSIHEIEPIVPDFIMEDVIEEICSVKPGVAVSFGNDEHAETNDHIYKAKVSQFLIIILLL